MLHLTGSCLCRTIQIRGPDRFAYVGFCHCSECRKYSGSAFGTAAGIEAGELEILQGEQAIAYYPKSEATILAFCRHCGSPLFSRKEHTGKINIRLGILDQAPTQKPGFHVFVGSKALWDEICDGLPQFEAGAPASSTRG